MPERKMIPMMFGGGNNIWYPTQQEAADAFWKAMIPNDEEREREFETLKKNMQDAFAQKLLDLVISFSSQNTPSRSDG